MDLNTFLHIWHNAWDEMSKSALRPLFYPLLGSERIYLLYSLSSLLIMIVVLVVIKQKNLKETFSTIFSKAVYTHPSALTDYQYFYLNSMIQFVILLPFFGALSPAISGAVQNGMSQLGVNGPLGESTPFFNVLYTVCLALVADFAIFLAHWWEHKNPFLWEFHKVHHSAEVLTPMTVYRMHPLDDALTIAMGTVFLSIVDGFCHSLFSSQLGMIGLFGLNIITYLFYLLGYNIRHSHIWVSYTPFWHRIFISPSQHQIHHSVDEKHFDTNMGFIFSFWDAAFGTLYTPKEEEKIEFGLNRAGEHKEYHSVWQLFFLPFKKAFNMLKQESIINRLTTVLAGIGFIWALVFLKHLGDAPAPINTAPAQQIQQGQQASLNSVYLEELTWPETRQKIDQGTTTIIIPTGGTEQNGPHMVLGKHNYIIHKTSGEIASKLGNTLVAPVVSYVPEGNHKPAEQHMRYAGTISLQNKNFEALLEDSARSMKTHGFKLICFLGDSGWNQDSQKHVTDKLNTEWNNRGVRVLSVSEYYFGNGQTQWLLDQGESQDSIGTHASIRDTSELLAVYPQGVREKELKFFKKADQDKTGAHGDATKASAKLGKQFLEMKVQAALRQIRAELAKMK